MPCHLMLRRKNTLHNHLDKIHCQKCNDYRRFGKD
jgi:hypothetical protein